MSKMRKIYIPEDKIPKAWYNVKADMKELPDPLLNPQTGKVATLEDLSKVFCTELAKQELNTTDRYIEIPEEVREFYKIYRPSPVIRAYNLEKELQTPAKIYFKFEGNNTSGSHKLNSAAAQVYYAKKQGLTSLTTETGAGQWGTALSMAGAYYNIPVTVYMVKTSVAQKPYRKSIMEAYGATVVPSPSNTTEVGRKILISDPETGGSLGCAISEAVETATKTDGCRYVLGSVLDQVALHQTIIGLETIEAMEMAGDYPDIIIGCAGGGSNLAGLAAPFVGQKLRGEHNPYIIAVEPESCPSMTRGTYAYDYCDTGKITPLAKMYTLGSGFKPSPIHAGGLRYHGMSPIVSKLYHDGYINEARTVSQLAVFQAATLFARVETILPAPESSHAICAAIQEAIKCRESGESKTILFNLTGTGYFDMTAYSAFRNGTMAEYSPSEEELNGAFEKLPKIE